MLIFKVVYNGVWLSYLYSSHIEGISVIASVTEIKLKCQIDNDSTNDTLYI